MMTLSELAIAVNGTQTGKDVLFSGVSIDGRSINTGDLYVAIKGERFDGHDFIQQASQAGAAGSLVEQTKVTDNPSVSVEQTRLALGMLGKYWRQRFDFPVIAITGSNGKTTVKELTTAVLARRYSMLATEGNLNNELGVPLTLLKLNTEHQAAVIEMGANHPGEIAYLANLVLPTIGVVTNAGAAHLEGFSDLQGVANAKGELFSALAENATAIINHDDVFYSDWKSLAGDRQTLSFGLSEQADIRANNIEMTHTTQGICSQFQLEYLGQSQIVNLPLSGLHNVVNGLAAAAVGIAADLTLAEIADGLASVAPVSGRLQTLSGLNRSILVNDSYNANPSSFEAALQTIQGFGTERWCVLGDFGELGEHSESLHQQLAQQAKKHGIKRIFATGELARFTVAEFGDGATFYESQDALITALKEQLNERVVVLVKGSRAQKLEKIVEAITDESAV
jgi:UDP-N-acetylmuramoyl-tripeptide--D-alanyl-D-alanine ligase